MHSERKQAHRSFSTLRSLGTSARFASVPVAGLLALAGCGSNYRPVVSSINPVGPASQPTKYAVVISATTPTAPGLVTFVDVSGDTILDTTAIGANPQYLAINTGSGFTLNGDGTLTSFQLTTSLRSNNVYQTTLPALAPGAPLPTSIYLQGTYTYIPEPSLNTVVQLNAALPPAVQQQLPTGVGTTYVVGANGAPRAYAIAPGVNGANGTVAAIETASNTVSSTIPVGLNPVYGVMSADGRRAFILNRGSNSVSVVNAETNALDTFTVNGVVSGTIPVGVAPIWADFAPTLAEMVVANAGNGSTPGSVTIVNIPLCSTFAVTSNPNCDPANPIDAVGFGQVIANIPVGVNPIMVAVLADGTRAYVANRGNAALGIPGSISVINLTYNTVTATIPAGSSIDQGDSLVHGHPTYISVTTGTPTGKVYVTSSDSTDLTIIRTDIDAVQTHLPLQGTGVQVHVNLP